MTRPSVQFDRLTLRTGSMSEADARRLAELVGLALGRIPALPKPVDAPKVTVDVASQAGRSVAEIADAVAAAIEAALAAEAMR
jgi:hypothetical protein